MYKLYMTRLVPFVHRVSIIHSSFRVVSQNLDCYQVVFLILRVLFLLDPATMICILVVYFSNESGLSS